MDAVRETWTALQRREGSDFLRWLDETQALRAGFRALSNGLLAVLKDQVQTEEQVRELWAAVPAVLSRCNDLKTYWLPGAPLAYAWLHLPERYVRTWQALKLLVENCLLPMGKHGVRALDVGTGPGPSAFATHDFYVAMTNYAELSGKGHWHQPPNLTCVESSIPMNSFRHQLAEVLAMYGAPQSVLAMCGNDGELESILPKPRVALQRGAEGRRLLSPSAIRVLGLRSTLHPGEGERYRTQTPPVSPLHVQQLPYRPVSSRQLPINSDPTYSPAASPVLFFLLSAEPAVSIRPSTRRLRHLPLKQGFHAACKACLSQYMTSPWMT